MVEKEKYIQDKKTEVINGSKISFLEEGKGKPVIALSGWPLGSEMYLRALKYFNKEKLHVYALDYPGWGQSDPLKVTHDYSSIAQWVIDFMDHKNIEKANFVGVSFGGALSLIVAAKHPERVDKIFVNSPPIYYQPYLPKFQKRLLDVSNRVPLVKSTLYKALTGGNDWVGKIFWGKKYKRDENDFTNFIKGTLKYVKLEPLYDMLRQIEKTDLRESAGYVKSPTLVITGSEDYMREDSRLASQIVTGSNFKLIPDRDHDMVVSYPDEFAGYVNDFFN